MPFDGTVRRMGFMSELHNELKYFILNAFINPYSLQTAFYES